MNIRVALTKSILIFTAAALLAAGQVIPEPRAAVAETNRAFSPFGMASHPMWGNVYSTRDIDTELDRMAAAGARWIRFDISWRYIERVRDTYDAYALSRLDYIVDGARARGIEPQIVVIETPSWANGGAGMFAPPTYMSHYAAFVRDMVARYRGRVTYWEIWNEPDLSQFWQPAKDPAGFAAMLRAAYTAAKQANPSAQIISGGLCGNNTKFLQDVYAAGAQGYFDLLGVHPYSGERGPYGDYWPGSFEEVRWNFGGLAEMKKIMEANGDGGKHMWISELGWSTGTFYQGVTEAKQAEYTRQAYERLINEFPYVDALMVYNARNKGTDPTSKEDNFGLMRSDYSPKPSYSAFKNAAETLVTGISLTASANTISYGRSTTLSAKVSPVGETPVVFQRQAAADTWEDVATTTASSTGIAQVTVKPAASSIYRAVAPERQLTSNPLRIKVRAQATIRSSRVVRRRRAVTIVGKVVVARSTRVYLQRKVGRRWVNVRRLNTRWSGAYRLRLRAYRRGRYYYRIRFYGNSSLLGTYSRATRVRVY